MLFRNVFKVYFIIAFNYTYFFSLLKLERIILMLSSVLMMYNPFFKIFEELFDKLIVAVLLICSLCYYITLYIYYRFLVLMAYMQKKLYVHIYICIHSAILFAIFICKYIIL